MSISGGGGDVTLGVSIEGLRDAEQGVQALESMIANLNRASVGGSSDSGGYMPSLGGGNSSGSFPTAAFVGSGISPTGSTPLPPGFGAPPAPGVQSNYGGMASTMPMPAYNPGMPMGVGGTPSGSGGGTTIIQAANVTIMGGATMPMQTGAPTAGGSGGVPTFNGMPLVSGGTPQSPLPGWNPFGGGTSGSGGNAPGFVESVYGRLDGMQGWQGAMGSHFLSSNPMGRQMMGMGAQAEQFLGQGALGGAGEMLAGAAPYLAIAAAVGEVAKTSMNIFGNSQLPGRYQQIREEATARSGAFYDPISLSYDRDAARIDGLDAGVESLYNSLPGQIARFVPGVSAFHDFVYQPKIQEAKAMRGARRDYDLNRRRFAQSFGRLAPDGGMPESYHFQSKTDLGEMLGADAYSQRDVVNGFNYNDYFTNSPFGFTDDDANRSIVEIDRTFKQPGFERERLEILNGADPRRYTVTALGSAVERGDDAALHRMVPELSRISGGIEAGRRVEQNLLVRNTQLSAYRTQGQIAGANLSAAQAGISMFGMSGAGYTDIALANQNLDPMFDAELASLQAQRQYSVNPLEQARLDAQMAQLRTQKFDVTKRQPAMMMFQGRQEEASTSLTRSGTAIRRGMFTGEADTYEGFAQERTALGQQEQVYRNMASSGFFSREERERYAAQADQTRMQISFDLPRERGQYSMGLRQGELGVRSTQADAAMTNASLFGGVGDVYQAQVKQTDIIRQQMSMNQSEMNGAFGPRTTQELLELREHQVRLQRDLNQSLEEAKRNYNAANISVAQFGQSMTQAKSGYQMQYLGVGGGAAAGLQSEDVAAARKTLKVAQDNFNDVAMLPVSNQVRQQRERDLQEAKAGVQGAIQGMASLPYSVDLDRQQMAGQFAFSAISRTYASYGDIRGTVQGLMNNVGERGQELQQMRAQGLKEIDSDPSLPAWEKEQRKQVFLRDIEQRQYGLGNELIGYQQQLESGWQDRLISQTYNMPTNGAWIMSQFTAREAAPFVQNITPVMGFSGKGAVEARDDFMHRGPRIANSVLGVIQRRDGFMETAMAEAGSGVLRGPTRGVDGSEMGNGTVTIRVIVEDTQGNRLGMGQSSGTIHDIFNTMGIVGSAHAKAVPRQ